ncbi:MAG: hypothetical protein CL941_07815 [Desulfobacter sp.]|nr:hypothetical protein [Desulfobacter sp.]
MSNLPMTFPHILIDNAKKFPPSKAAIREKDYGIWKSYSWQDYLDQVRDFALGLAALGFKKDDKMAIIGDNRPRLYWGMAACQWLGGVPVSLYQDAIHTPQKEDGYPDRDKSSLLLYIDLKAGSGSQ